MARAGEAHGFWNTADADRAVLIWCYGGGPARRRDAGLAIEPEQD